MQSKLRIPPIHPRWLTFTVAGLLSTGLILDASAGNPKKGNEGPKHAAAGKKGKHGKPPQKAVWFKGGNKKNPILWKVKVRRLIRSSPPGNNGIGQEKRGNRDGAPPGLIKNGKGQFNDGPGNRHGVDPGS